MDEFVKILRKVNDLEELQVGISILPNNNSHYTLMSFKVPANSNASQINITSIFNELGRMKNLTKLIFTCVGINDI